MRSIVLYIALLFSACPVARAINREDILLDRISRLQARLAAVTASTTPSPKPASLDSVPSHVLAILIDAIDAHPEKASQLIQELRDAIAAHSLPDQDPTHLPQGTLVEARIPSPAISPSSLPPIIAQRAIPLPSTALPLPSTALPPPPLTPPADDLPMSVMSDEQLLNFYKEDARISNQLMSAFVQDPLKAELAALQDIMSHNELITTLQLDSTLSTTTTTPAPPASGASGEKMQIQEKPVKSLNSVEAMLRVARAKMAGVGAI